MQEELLQNFDLQLTYQLCEAIIKKRDFKSLIELDKQCEYFYNEKFHFIYEQDALRANMDFCQPIDVDFSLQESALFILFYYIYYILLDKQERNIFTSLQNLILAKNLIMFEIYSTIPFIENNNDNIVQKNLYKCAMFILEKYTKTNILTEEVEIQNINSFIYTVKKEDFSHINDDFYLLYMLALGELNYKDILSSLSYDILIQQFNYITNVILDKNNTNDFILQEFNEEEDAFNNEAEQLRF